MAATGHDSTASSVVGSSAVNSLSDGVHLWAPYSPSRERGKSNASLHVSFIQVSANFSLQTKGTEVPRDRLSRHSPVVTLRTNFEGQGPLGDVGRLEKGGGAPASVKARLATAKALDDSISASEGAAARSSLSGLHPLHGQYVATGKGGLYL